MGTEDFERALLVVRHYLEARSGGPREASEHGSEPHDSMATPRAPTALSPAPLAPPAPTQLSVDGNIDATSFTGDGANLAIASGQVRCSSLSGSNLSQELRTGLTASSTGTPSGSVSLCEFAETGQSTPGAVIAQEKFSV